MAVPKHGPQAAVRHSAQLWKETFDFHVDNDTTPTAITLNVMHRKAPISTAAAGCDPSTN